jgi:hypothetical protein
MAEDRPRPEEVAWGKQLADFLPNHPLIANLVFPAFATDPSELIYAIQNNEKLNIIFGALCNGLEADFARQAHEISAVEADAFSNHDRIRELETENANNARAIRKLILSGEAAGNAVSRQRLTQDPPKFKGEERDITRRQQEYVNFRDHVNRCLTVDSSVFNSEFRKIQYLAGLLDGNTLDLNRENFRLITEHPEHPELWVWKTTKDVWAALDSQYETLDLSQDASIRYDNLRMTNKPFQNFVAEFNMLAAKCGKTSEQMVADMKLKISDELNNATQFRHDKPGKGDVMRWQKLYQDLYNDIQERHHIDKMRANRGPQRSDQRQPSARQENRAPPQAQAMPPGDPMVLDAARSRMRPSREQCFREGLCFYCKKPGHNIDGCREKIDNDVKYGKHQRHSGVQHQQHYQSQQHQQHYQSQQPYQSQPQYQLQDQPLIPAHQYQPQHPTTQLQSNPMRGRGGFRSSYDRGNFGNYGRVRFSPYSPSMREVDLGGHVEEESLASEPTAERNSFPAPEEFQRDGSGKA